ncbi:MAG: NUDIX hydrolase [Acidimicrobiia bacterium]|nr:NUDIX hydrolase [Acidimicrobiia bacterium]
MASYDPAEFPPFAVTVDIVLLTVADEFSVMLVRRGVDPFAGVLALPGGFVLPDESVEDAAHRELAEETGLSASALPGVHLEQLATFGDVGRDPRMRVVSVAYLGLSRLTPLPTAGTDAADAQWLPVSTALAGHLAFDHREMLEAAVERVRAKLEYTTLATTLAGEAFTLGDLHRIYEIVWNEELDLANFRRKVLATDGFVESTGAKRVSTAGGAPATVYRRGSGTLLNPPLSRRPRAGH